MESVMFHLRAAAPSPPLSLAAPETTHVLFRSRIGGGVRVGWPAVLVGTKVSEKTLLGLPMIGSDNQIMKQD